MTRRFLAFLLSCLAAATLLAQGKDMGQAAQYYKASPPKKGRFSFIRAPKRGGEVHWEAEHQTIEKDEYAILEGHVVFSYEDVKLTCDKMTYNLKTKDVVAEGHVILDQGSTRLAGDQAVFNTDTKTGTFFHATGSMEPAMYFTGDKIEKLSDDTYRLTNGVLTSCDLDSPSWSFHVRVADVTVDDFAHMHDISFRVHRLPLFWAPRLVWPTKKDRSRGLLIPRLFFWHVPTKTGTLSSSRLELGYFIPFGDSVDATIYADLDSKSYNGVGVDFRYLPSPDVKIGELNAYTVHDPESRKQQWKYAYRHSQENLPGGFRGVVDVEDFSDLDFFRKFDKDPRLHTLSQIYSSAYLTKNSSTYSFNILSDRRDIILGHTDPTDLNSPIVKQRFEQLPSLQFRVYPNRLFGSPIYFSMESSASHLVTSGLVNGPSADYFRGDLFPTVSMQIPSPPWFSVKPQISARETYYSSTLAPTDPTMARQQLAVDESLRRFYAQGQVEIVGPSFSRVYNDSLGGFTRFKHVIEPRLRYVYTTNVTEDQQRVIRFDTVDTPFLPIVPNSVEYSLTQRLIGKEKGDGSAREVLSFSLRQSVSLSKPFTSSTGGSIPGSTVPPGENKFTPLLASLHVNPYQSLTLDASATFGNVSHQLDQTSLAANLVGTGKYADKYLSFSWFSSFTQPGQPATSSNSQIRLNTGSSLLRDKIRADVQLNYDARQGIFLEQRYLLGANASCYGVAFEYRRYLVYDPFPKPTSSYGIAVTLKNVGTIGTH
ncbi:MAG TPA: LPS assembly protein LptD [Thermoanaerobaculia bacterium]|nr:LPS assembly protein LptD [Thermoanaerobaculia bacterium]